MLGAPGQIGRVGRTRRGAAAPAFVAPANRRVAASNATDTIGGDEATNTIAALNAMGSSKAWVQTLYTPTGVRTITFDIEAVEAPGALWYYDFNGAKNMAEGYPKLEQSDDGDTWEDITRAPWGPSGRPDEGTNWARFISCGQFMFVAPGAGRTMRWSADTGSDYSYGRFALYQLNADKALNDIWILPGNSIAGQECLPEVVNAAIRELYPDSDPMVFKTARGGAHLSDILSEQFEDEDGIPALAAFASRVVLQPTINDVFSNLPYSTDSGAAARIEPDFEAVVAAAEGLGLTVYSTDVSVTNTPSQDGFTDMDYSSAPYNQNIYWPLDRGPGP